MTKTPELGKSMKNLGLIVRPNGDYSNRMEDLKEKLDDCMVRVKNRGTPDKVSKRKLHTTTVDRDKIQPQLKLGHPQVTLGGSRIG